MTVTEIQIHAGRTFNHPYESYSNFRPGITLKATLEPGEDPEAAIKSLQAQAESLIEDHKNHLLRSLAELEEMRRDQAEIARLRDAIRRAQDDLDRLRAKTPQSTLSLTADDDDDDDEKDLDLD